MDSSYISHFRDSTPSFFLHSYLIYIELLSILRQKYNPVKTKTDIGGEKYVPRTGIRRTFLLAICFSSPAGDPHLLLQRNYKPQWHRQTCCARNRRLHLYR